MRFTKPSLASLAAGALTVGLGTVLVPTASAYAPTPSNVYVAPNPGSCNKSPCILYPKSVQLPGGRLVMSFEDSQGPVVGQDLPVYKSDDNGDTWQPLSTIKAPAEVSDDPQYAGLTSNWTNPYLYVLPEDLGPYAKGTLLLSSVASSGQAGSNDRFQSAIVLWASTDQGASWKLISKVVASPSVYQGTTGDTVWQDPTWEPYLLMRGGELVVYYSDERDFLGYDAATGVAELDPDDASSPDSGGQILAHTSWKGSGSWSAPVVDVAGLTETKDGKTRIGGGRPGMTNIVPTTDGKWLLTYEYWAGGDNINFKIADDPRKFYAVGGAAGTGISQLPVAAGSGKLAQGGSPVLIRRPDGGLVYNAAGSTSVWVNESGRSDGVWKEYQTPAPGGYSRNLQFVDATGRLQILQAPWGTGPVTSTQVDLGHSAGTYYSLVNRATGEVLSTEQDKTQDANLTGDRPDIITWRDNPANDTQRWHAVDKGGNVTFLNKAGGRALAIWQGNAAAGSRVSQWVDDNGSDKVWKVIPGADGYVKIQSTKNSSVYLSGSGAGGAVTLQNAQPATADDAQEWALVAEGDSTPEQPGTPTTVSAVVGGGQPNAAGWYKTPVAVTLTPSTTAATVQYRLTGQDTWSTADGPVKVTSEGLTTLEYRALNGTEPVAGTDGSLGLKLDTTAPNTSATVDPASGVVPTGSTITATFAGSDAGSGVDVTEYSLDAGSTWQRATSRGVSFTDTGSHVVQYRSVDAAGNQEAAKSVTLTVAAATARATITSADAPSSDGWYQQPVLVALASPKSSQKIQYRLNGGSWRSYSGSLTIGSNGVTTLDHRLLENNVVVANSQAQTQIKVDRVAPNASVVRDPGSGNGTPRNPIALTFSGSDTLSGLAQTQYRLNSGAWTEALDTPVVLGAVGDYVVTYRTVDRAGNSSATKSLSVSITPNAATTVKPAASSVKAGAALTLSLTGFARWDDVTLTLGDAPLGTVVTDRDGSARVTVRIPAATATGAVTITARGSGPVTAASKITIRR